MKKFKVFYSCSLLILICMMLLTACERNFLDRLNDDSLVVPETLEDLEALLDNTTVMNGTSTSSGCPLPVLGEASTDDFFFDDVTFASQSLTVRNLYTWQPYYTYDMTTLRSWFFPYRSIMYANVVLDHLHKIERASHNDSKWDRIRGAALFYRANVYYHLAQVYAYPYSKEMEEERSLPVRLEADVSAAPNIPNLKQYYQMIIDDVESAIVVLPEITVPKTRPSQAASHALLAKVYLVMHDYSKAQFHAETALSFHGDLLDYNILDKSQNYPIPQLNTEVLFHIKMNLDPVQNTSKVSKNLYEMYESGDLRKELYFSEQGYYRGSYDGDDALFGGFTTSELYLIVAECLARDGQGKEALSLLDRLRKKRFAPEHYADLLYIDAETSLRAVLDERRRELVLRGSTWSDLRRLNQYEFSKRTLTRVVEGETITLPPSDLGYTLLIPEETVLTLNIEQNKR